MDHPNLNLILTFLLVLEKGSFVAAGKELGIPASTVSRRVGQLESDLQVTLLDRSTRQVTATRAGNALRESSLPLMERLLNAVRAVSEQGENPQSRLRISVPPNHSQLIARLALDFHRQHPWISLQLITTDRRMSLREEGIDLVIRVSRSIATAGEADLVLKPLLQYRHILCCSPEYRERFGEPTQPNELPGLPCIGWGQSDKPICWEFEGDLEKQTLLLHPSLIFNEYMAVQEVISEGYGIGELPSIFCAQALREGRLVRILKAWRLPSRFLLVGFLKREFMPESVRLFLEHCHQWQWYEDTADLAE